MKKTIQVLQIFFFAFLAISANGQPTTQQNWQGKIAQSLWARQHQTDIQFFVYLKEQADVSFAQQIRNKAAKGNFVYQQLLNTATQTQSQLIHILETQNAPYQPFLVVNGIWAKGNFELVQLMAQQPEVAHVFYNAPIRAEELLETNRNPNLNYRIDSTTWGIAHMKAPVVWNMGYKGQGVVIGGQDTGFAWEIPNLKEKYRGWNGTTANHNYNWHDAIHEYSPLGDSINLDCGLDTLVPCDDNGHGTHTLGTMIATDTSVLLGVAPEAQWIGCRNMEDGWGSPQTYLECFEWFLAPTDLNNDNPNPSKAPHVINNSWGCPTYEGCDTSNFVILETVINNLKLAGVVVVVSAGNDGPSCNTIKNPASIYENSFSVGALGMNDTITSFSSRGTVTADGSNRLKPNVTAPGQAVTSYYTQGSGNDGFIYLNASGTSMAGPHVAGLVALMISADTTLAGDVNRIENIIEQTARGYTFNQNCGGISGTAIPNAVYGYGVIDAEAAVQMALNTANTAQPPTTNANAQIFPNPFHQNIWIKLDGFNGNTYFELYAADGRLVQQTTWNVSWHSLRQVTTNNLSAGVYFYKIFDNNNSVQGKLLKR